MKTGTEFEDVRVYSTRKARLVSENQNLFEVRACARNTEHLDALHKCDLFISVQDKRMVYLYFIGADWTE